MHTDKSLTATFWKESGGTCDCCGNTSKTIWGDLSNEDGTVAVYFVQWTVNQPTHPLNVDLVIGPWGEGTSPSQRYAVSLAYMSGADGGSFMVIDAEGRKASGSSICAKAMSRNEVIGTAIAAEAFALVDALWLTEPRIAELMEVR